MEPPYYILSMITYQNTNVRIMIISHFHKHIIFSTQEPIQERSYANVKIVISLTSISYE